MTPATREVEDVEGLVAQAIAALNARDVDALLALSHPDLELHSRVASIEGGGVYRGREGVERYFGDLTASFRDIAWSLSEIIGWQGDDLVLVIGFRGRGISSGVPVELLTPQVWSFRRDRPWRNVTYATRQEALAAVGLDEPPR